jgi:hypothetical protein
MTTLPVYARSNGSATGVAAATEIAMSVPPRGVIKRVRVSKTSGTATTLTVEVLEAAGGTGTDVAISYSAAASVDNEESIFYSVSESSPGAGILYVKVTPDAGSNAVIARLDIEKVA